MAISTDKMPLTAESLFEEIHRVSSSPPELYELILGCRGAKVLFTAVELDLFHHIQNGADSAGLLCERLSLDERACEIVLNALTALKFLRKSSGRFINTPVTLKHLLKTSPESLYHTLRFQNVLFRAWADLTDVVRSGSPQKSLLTLLRDDRFKEDYVQSMVEISREPAREVALKLADDSMSEMMDMACGPGTFSVELLKLCPQLRAALLDLPTTLLETRKKMDASPFSDRISYIESNYHSCSFKERAYDLVLMSHMTHNEGVSESKELILRAAQSLRRGGKLAVHDFAVSSDGCDPLFGALYSVHMLVFTEKGLTHKASDYVSWLKEAGLKDVEQVQICPDKINASTLFVGRRP